MTNKALIFKKVPEYLPVAGQDLVVEDIGFDSDAPAPQGGLTLEVLYASFDPYQRGRMRDANVKSYSPPYELGKPITNDVVGKVLKSNVPDFNPGDLVLGARLPIAEKLTIGSDLVNSIHKLHNPHNLDVALFLGPLGMPGLTAYSSLFKIGSPSKGETMFISSAAGAVGQIVGNIAKRQGLTVIGSVGSDEKVDFVTRELGFHSAFNYNKEKPADALARLAPNGIDIYFENVGGEHLEAALQTMNVHGRIIVCGMIAEYNTPPDKRTGIKNLFQLVAKQITMRGFLVFDKEFGGTYFDEHQKNVQQWLVDGSLIAKLDITDGVDNAATGLISMLKGGNFGKAVLKIKDA